MDVPAQCLDPDFQRLADMARDADSNNSWPESSWKVLHEAGVETHAIPKSFGGIGLEPRQLLRSYAEIASKCLTTSFILSQREAAVRRIVDSDNEHLRSQVLPKLAAGSVFATVGLSQLTTSRQHIPGTLRAWREANWCVLDGTIPWVTSALRADLIVIGANLIEGGQILAAIPRETPGVEIGDPMQLMALQGSQTAEVTCRNVRVPHEWLLKGPSEKVMGIGKGGTGSLETSCLALGLTHAALGFLYYESKQRPELALTYDVLLTEYNSRLEEMNLLAEITYSAEQAIALRSQTNTLVLRATQAALTAAKGAGFLLSHPAQRWARQAMFFLVWSCPRPAAEATLAYLAGSMRSGESSS